MKTGDLIKVARKVKRYSQDELAEKIGKTKNYISLIEGGKKTPSLKILRKFSIVLDIPFILLVKEKLDFPNPKNKEEKQIIEKLEKLYELSEKYYIKRLKKGDG